jgi:hypothetical protein
MAYTKGITEERHIKLMPAKAGAAVSPYRILANGTDPDEVIHAAGSGVTPLGVSGNASENHASTYAEHDPIEMRYDGVMYIEMAGTGSRADRVMADSVGKGTRHGNSVGAWCCGIATKDWVAGEIIPVVWHLLYVDDAAVS